MSHITPSYRGFRLETLVFHDPAGDPNGEVGKAARQALDAIGPALTVKMDPQPPK